MTVVPTYQRKDKVIKSTNRPVYSVVAECLTKGQISGASL